jgi:NAD(P)-dependent dehydrogenase (short-subunit alcohol dehydrogenase family)
MRCSPTTRSMASFSAASDPGSALYTMTRRSAPCTVSTSQSSVSQPRDAGMRINAVDPGYTATDLNGNRGTQTVSEGAVAIVRMSLIGSSGPTGTFVDARGDVPW